MPSSGHTKSPRRLQLLARQLLSVPDSLKPQPVFFTNNKQDKVNTVRTYAKEGVTEEEEDRAFREYCLDAKARALALGNRGPLRFDADGRLAQDIVDKYVEIGFYVFENVLSPPELSEFRAEFEALLENAPANGKGSETDKFGRPVRHPQAYTFGKPLSDEIGGTKFGIYNFNTNEPGKPRHQIKMREPTVPEGAPEVIPQSIQHPLLYLDSALRIYGHPKLLRAVETINGPDFTPFTETLLYKTPGLGVSTSWHQDPSSAWDEEWAQPGFDPCKCGFSFHASLYECTPENGLWVLPGTHKTGRVDQEALALKSGGTDRFPGAVPILCGPGDVYIHNRLALHCSFPNTSPTPRGTLILGFHKKSSVFGKHTRLVGGKPVVYDERYIDERSRMIQLAIDARRQKYPDEEAYIYQPFKGREEQVRWSEQLKETSYGKYWTKDIAI